MDLFRAFLAIVISFVILMGYQYFFVKPVPPQQGVETVQQQTSQAVTPSVQIAPTAVVTKTVAVDPEAKLIQVETPLYKAVISEQGGGFQSFVLNNYRNDLDEESGPMELVPADQPQNLPIQFSLDNGNGGLISLFKADQDHVVVGVGGQQSTLTMQASLTDGTVITRTLTFRADSYLIDDVYQVTNNNDTPVQISPALTLNNQSFSHDSATSRFLFSGPSAYVNNELIETKLKKLQDGPLVLQGGVSWTGYVDNYFMTSVIPRTDKPVMVTVQGNEEQVRSVISLGIEAVQPKVTNTYSYAYYFGPKKLKILQATGDNLAKAVNFGWFDMLAKPMLWLLNFFYDYTKNYGIAIILVTVLIKAVFWPITQKGMKSMKNMQKLQPKVAKLKEKFKDDPTKMNQEMMAMYKTYKVNPLGGCLPMVIQIPFFFALYRVLMAAIELRHAPFLLWINDLSAPDRLWIGIDIPYLHGLPVLTLLMGASMYLQQKMTPTTADPTQAKIMQMLPVIFTFMFINFASGLVLYWFINNLLSILQQQLINRQIKAQ